LNATLIIRQHVERLHQPASLLQQFAHRRTGAVLPPAARRGIAENKDFGAKWYRSLQPSAVSFRRPETSHLCHAERSEASLQLYESDRLELLAES
jgi:hypothetical protein